MEQRFTLVGIMAIVGISLGLGIGVTADYYPYVTTPIYCAVLGAIFTYTGLYLNDKGLLYNIYQLIDLLVGFILYYLFFLFIFALIMYITGLEQNLNALLSIVVPTPFAILLLFRNIRKRSFKRRTEIDGEYFELVTQRKKKRKTIKWNINWKKIMTYSLLLIAVSLFVIYIFPGMYIYDKYEQKYPVKINRFTGDTFILDGESWVKVRDTN